MTPRKRQLLTLQPHRVRTPVQEVYDISGYTGVRLRIPNPPTEPLHTILDYAYPSQKVQVARFPADTKGCFYFHQQGNTSPLSAEVRFRICESITAFDDGHDLPYPTGFQPWHLPLYTIARSDDYSGLRHLLIKESLVDPDVLADLAQLPIHRRLSTVLYDLEQPFTMDVSSSIRLNLITRKSMRVFVIRDMFSESFNGKRYFPYSGRAQMRLVPSTLPEDAENWTFFLQFLKFVTPIQCLIPNYSLCMRKPEIGEYLQKKDVRTRELKPYKLDMKKFEVVRAG